MNWARPIRVVGVGSPRGDDAVAWTVVTELEKAAGAHSGFEYHRMDGGQHLLDLLDGRGSLVIIDALSCDAPAGTVVSFSWPDERVEALRPGSTHDLGPATALRLAAALGTLPPHVAVYGIAGVNFDDREGLSPELTDRVETVVAQLRGELGLTGSTGRD